MKRKVIIPFAIAVIASLIIYSCVDNDNTVIGEKSKDENIFQGPIQGVGTPARWIDVDKQIEWIAKGFVPLADQVAGFRKLVHEACETAADDEMSISDAHNQADLNLGYDLQTGHEGYVDSYFPSNNYDYLYFPGFDDYENFIWIPDIDSVDSTHLHVLVPTRTWELLRDTTKGFYLDSNGNVDSLDIYWNKNPTHDYYIWVITYEAPGPDATPISPPREVNHCGDGYCDHSNEDASWCPDCDPDPIVNPNGVKDVYQVKLTEIDVYGDEKQYFESWLSNKYNFWFAGCVYNGSDEILYEVGITTVSPDWTSNSVILQTNINRKDVCRTNGSREYNCPSTAHIYDALVVDDFREGDNLLLIGYEYNDNIKSSNEFNISMPNLHTSSGSAVFYDINCGRNDKAVNPFHSKDEASVQNLYNLQHAQTHNGEVAYFPSSEIITVNSFSGAGSSIVIDNGEWKYTLELVLKQ
ncbi:hypothetical protein GC194_01475 [bacterium]|nr:hypothetical protein [bacterium]